MPGFKEANKQGRKVKAENVGKRSRSKIDSIICRPFSTRMYGIAFGDNKNGLQVDITNVASSNLLYSDVSPEYLISTEEENSHQVQKFCDVSEEIIEKYQRQIHIHR